MLTMIENQVFALCPLKPLQLGFDIRYCRLPLQVRCTMPTGSLLVSWVQADALANYKSLDDIMSVTRYIFVMMMMTTLLGMALGCLLAWCCCCPRPCVDAVRPALASTQGTMRAHRLWLISRWTLWRFFCQRWQIHRRHRQRHFQWPLLVVGSSISIGAKTVVASKG